MYCNNILSKQIILLGIGHIQKAKQLFPNHTKHRQRKQN